jgi:hypothetical protein
MMENRIERIRVYSHIHDQKLSYLNKWHQDVDAFYRSNHAESADIINNMQHTLSEYVEAYNTLVQLQKTLDSMGEEGATLDQTVVEKQENSAETLAAFELQGREFKKAQEEFSDYMDRLQEDIALKAEKFGHVEFYDARLQDGYSNSMAVAASEVQSLDERRKPLAVTNPLLAKEASLLPEPSVEDVTFEHLSMNLPSIAVNALDEVSRIAIECEAPATESHPDLVSPDEGEPIDDVTNNEEEDEDIVPEGADEDQGTGEDVEGEPEELIEEDEVAENENAEEENFDSEEETEKESNK